MDTTQNTTKPGKPQETRAQRDARLLAEGLRDGVKVVRAHLSNYVVTSASEPGKEYEVYCGTWDHRRVERCACEWGQRVGDVITDNPGTQQHQSNGVRPCKHIYVLRWQNLSVPDREAIAAVHPCLRPYIYWDHETPFVLCALLARADAWQQAHGGVTA